MQLANRAGQRDLRNFRSCLGLAAQANQGEAIQARVVFVKEPVERPLVADPLLSTVFGGVLIGAGLGAEINYARQRDFDQLFGLQRWPLCIEGGPAAM